MVGTGAGVSAGAVTGRGMAVVGEAVSGRGGAVDDAGASDGRSSGLVPPTAAPSEVATASDVAAAFGAPITAGLPATGTVGLTAAKADVGAVRGNASGFTAASVMGAGVHVFAVGVTLGPPSVICSERPMTPSVKRTPAVHDHATFVPPQRVERLAPPSPGCSNRPSRSPTPAPRDHTPAPTLRLAPGPPAPVAAPAGRGRPRKALSPGRRRRVSAQGVRGLSVSTSRSQPSPWGDPTTWLRRRTCVEL